MTMNMGHDLGLLLPEIALVLTGVAALITGMVDRHRWAMPVTVAGLLIATALTVPLIGDDATVFLDTYRVDSLSIVAKLVLLPATALTSVLAVPEVRGTDREATVHSLLAFTTVGALAMAGTNDVMFLVLGTLLSSLGSFALVAYPRTDRATEGAMKYFVFGTVAGAAMTFGLTYWFGGTGSTLLTDLGRLDGKPLPAALGFVAVLVGLGYKAALVPVHFWAPDAYDGGPLAVAAYLSVVPKIGAIIALAAVVRDLPETVVDWRPLLAVLAVVSMTYGNLAALFQTSIVRLLAYSSIAQSGFFLLGVIAVGRDDLAIPAIAVFAAAYAAMNIGAFAIAGLVGRNLSAFTGVGQAALWTGIGMAVFLLSLVGVPPFAGFAGKLLLFGAAIGAGYTWLAVVGVLNSVLSLAVYLRVIVPMYQPGPSGGVAGPARLVVWSIALVLTVVLGPATGLLLRVVAG